MNWSQGYVTEVEYTRGYYKELNPLLQSFAIAATGRHARNLESPFVKVELGCGYGLSLLLEAAAFPHAQFFGLDFNPSHITWAQRIAAEAGLTNVTFFDSSFAELLDLPIPPADFVALHGVWSWINEDNRIAIKRYLKARLNPGGVTMVSYNVHPGWAELRGLRELMMRRYRSVAGSVETRIRAAMEFARTIAAAGGPFFNERPSLIQAIENLSKLPLRYIAHEYFNDDWHLFHHHDVAGHMAETGSTFMASCVMIENFEQVYLPPNAPALLEQVSGPDRQTIKDIHVGKNFRYDIYARVGDKPETLSNPNYLNDWWISLLNQNFSGENSGLKTSVGTIALPNSLWDPLVTRLKQGPASGHALARGEGEESIHPGRLAEIIAILIEANIVSVALPPEGLVKRKSSTDKLNSVFLNRFLRGDDVPYLVSPVLGTAHQVSDVDRMFVLGLQSGSDPVGFAAQGLRRIGRRLPGTAGETPENILKELATRFQSFSDTTMPQLQRIGIM